MKILIAAGMEGVSGVTRWEETNHPMLNLPGFERS